MKKFVVSMLCLFVALSFSLVFAAEYQDQHDHSSCKHCGMDRTKFAHSRMLVEYDSGEQVGTCSLHCVTRELREAKADGLKSLKVADFYSHKLIDSADAFWVLGGDKKGVMTMRAKWAFETEEGARKFIAAHGGKLATAGEAMAASSDDMVKDMARMKKMKKMKAMKKKKMGME